MSFNSALVLPDTSDYQLENAQFGQSTSPQATYHLDRNWWPNLHKDRPKSNVTRSGPTCQLQRSHPCAGIIATQGPFRNLSSQKLDKQLCSNTNTQIKPVFPPACSRFRLLAIRIWKRTGHERRRQKQVAALAPPRWRYVT